MAIFTTPTTGVAKFIDELARQHNVHYVRTCDDALADVITRLADDEVITDDTEDAIVALKRAHVIDADTMVALLGRYLDEKHRLNSLIRRGEDVMKKEGYPMPSQQKVIYTFHLDPHREDYEIRDSQGKCRGFVWKYAGKWVCRVDDKIAQYSDTLSDAKVLAGKLLG